MSQYIETFQDGTVIERPWTDAEKAQQAKDKADNAAAQEAAADKAAADEADADETDDGTADGTDPSVQSLSFVRPVTPTWASPPSSNFTT